jgi:hypothetical protein
MSSTTKQVAGPLVPEPLPFKIRSSYQRLLTAATELNSASDRFAKLVGEIDAVLKPLNIGITSWVTMNRWSGEHSSGYDQVGYTKVGGKWCVALSAVEERPDRPEDDEEVWAFSEGPRRLRLMAIDYLPNLLDALAKEAVGETKNIAEKTHDLQELVSALKDGGKQ